MKHLFRTLILVATIAVAASFSADAKKKTTDLIEKYPALAPYFSTPTEEAIQPDDRGFIPCTGGNFLRRQTVNAPPFVHPLSNSDALGRDILFHGDLLEDLAQLQRDFSACLAVNRTPDRLIV